MKQDTIELFLSQNKNQNKIEKLNTISSQHIRNIDNLRNEFMILDGKTIHEKKIPFSKDTGALKVWIGTWNIGGQNVDFRTSIAEWIQMDRYIADIYCFCCQELVKSI